MLKYFFHKFHSLDDHIPTAVALPMYLLELVESKHHSDNDEPDLFLVVQNLLGVILNQFEQDFQHSLEQRHTLTLLLDEFAEWFDFVE